MAFRYRVRDIVDNEVIDARDWNQNMAEFAGEFNGHVDRDNLPELAVDSDRLAAASCSVVGSTQAASNPDGDRVDWQTIQTKTITLSRASEVEIEAGGWFFTTGLSVTAYLAARLLIDGIEVSRAPRVGLGNGVGYWGLAGTMPAAEGDRVCEVQLRLYDSDYAPPGGTHTTQQAQLIAVGRTV